jgi:hypothetical protein
MVVYRYSVTFKAPIKFDYEWCTDYGEDDLKITGANFRRIILEKTKKRVIYESPGLPQSCAGLIILG